MIICVAQALVIFGEGIDVGGLDLRSEAAAIAEAEVVCDDDQEIRPF